MHGSVVHFWLVPQQSVREEVARCQEMLLQYEFFVEDAAAGAVLGWA
jgi:hypothetical protein